MIELPAGVRMLRSGRYEARISINGTQYTLGTFDDPAEAGEAWLRARVAVMHFLPKAKSNHLKGWHR